MSSTALWLDPFRSLKSTEQALLDQAGVSISLVRTFDELATALKRLEDEPALLVLGLGSDIELLKETWDMFRNIHDKLAVICRVERKNLELAVAAMRHGACHVLAADDWTAESWRDALVCANSRSDDATSNARISAVNPVPSKRQLSAALPRNAVRSVVFVDPVSIKLLALAQRVAQAQVTVLLEGPTGSGKEVLARVLHESSPSQGGPFIGLNCAALPEHMIEDMLFGHEKGAFTGAVKDHRGMFEQAQGGTIFLDEVGDLPIGLQAKLLRVLQERSLVKLGSERAIALDVRVIAATNKNLRLAIERREFREDLYFRLSTFKLRVPPVAERRGDILPLVARVLARHQRDDGVWTVSPAAQACLLSYAWPGNVREIENVVQRAMVLCTDRHIDEHHLMFDDAPDPVGLVAMLQVSTELSCPFEPLTSETKVSMDYREVDLVGRSKLQTVVKQSENHVIRSALETSKNRVEAAQKLGISPRTLRYKLAQLRDHTSAQLASA
jgi:two-component system response regulator FlrC